MPNPRIATVRSYLSTGLTALIGTGSGKLMDVKTGHAQNFAGYPACRFYFKGTPASTLEDQKNVKRSFQFSIELIYKMAGDDQAAIEALLEDAMEAVMDFIEADFTLGGAVQNAMITGSQIQEVDAPWGVSLILPMTLTVLTLQFF